MSSLAHMFPLFMVLSWVYTSSMTIKSIVHEKEEKLKEIMHVLGLNNAVHWCSWFIDSFIPMSITAFFLSILLVVSTIVHYFNHNHSITIFHLSIHGINKKILQ